MLITLLSLSVLLIIFCIIFSIYLLSSFFTQSPFVPIKRMHLSKIVDTLRLKQNSVLYDLGCGDARVLIEATNRVKDITAVGIEKNIIVYLWSKWCTRHNNIQIFCDDISNISFKDATHIYMYLNTRMMDRFLIKFKKECKPGTRIVSCVFTFSNLTPDEVIDTSIKNDGMCKKMYVYILK